MKYSNRETNYQSGLIFFGLTFLLNIQIYGAEALECYSGADIKISGYTPSQLGNYFANANRKNSNRYKDFGDLELCKGDSKVKYQWFIYPTDCHVNEDKCIGEITAKDAKKINEQKSICITEKNKCTNSIVLLPALTASLNAKYNSRGDTSTISEKQKPRSLSAHCPEASTVTDKDHWISYQCSYSNASLTTITKYRVSVKFNVEPQLYIKSSGSDSANTFYTNLQGNIIKQMSGSIQGPTSSDLEVQECTDLTEVKIANPKIYDNYETLTLYYKNAADPVNCNIEAESKKLILSNGQKYKNELSAQNSVGPNNHQLPNTIKVRTIATATAKK